MRSTIQGLKKNARAILESFSAYAPEHRNARQMLHAERITPLAPVLPQPRHLHAAISWIKKAQDAGNSGGVAWGFRARRPVRTYLPLGWIAPYPETTGYIIPTMLRYGESYQDEDSMRRARRMLDWELQIQLPDGGMQGGVIGAGAVQSSTFVTGQVLFGLLAAYQLYREEGIRLAAFRAGEFLLSCLDESGRFVKGFSLFCAPGAKVYEARTGLALAELAEVTGEESFRRAASRIAEYALSMQNPNGWFRENDLDFHDRPLTHTIGYVLEGLHGIGNLTHRSDCIRAVQKALDAIMPLTDSNGFLPGRIREDWTAAVDWSCLTGSAQIAGVLLRMYHQTGRSEYLEAGRRLLGFVCFTQELRIGMPELDGGIRGSFPFGGEYGQWCVLNWATKFFCDSIMEYLQTTSLPLSTGPASMQS